MDSGWVEHKCPHCEWTRFLPLAYKASIWTVGDKCFHTVQVRRELRQA